MIELLLDGENEMQTLKVESSESLDVFALNHLNVRDWSAYSVSAKIQEGRLVFIADSKDAPKNLQETLNSLIRYENSEETVNGTAVVYFIEPLLVAPKNAVPGFENQNVLLSGNSRIVLTRNMIAAYQNDLTAEDQQIYSLRIDPIRYESKKGFKQSDLLTLQYTANSTITLTPRQKAKLIEVRMTQLREEDPEKYAGKGKAQTGALRSQIMLEFGINNSETYNKFRQLAEEVDPFIVEKLDSGIINNLDVAIALHKLLSNKQYGHEIGGPEMLWKLVSNEAGSGNFVTLKHVNKVKKELEEEFGTIEEKEDQELDSSDETGSSDEGTRAKNETKLQEIERLRNLERSVLNDEVVQKGTDLVEVILGVDPTQFDLDDAIKLHLLFGEIASRVAKFKTVAQKELAVAQKAAEKEAKAAEKAAAKAATETPVAE